MMASIAGDQSRHTSADEAAKTSAARLSIFAAVFLLSLKLLTGLLTGSISVWASLLDSAMDIIASSINFVAVRASARPPDAEHTYGHGKVESLAGLLQAAVIVISGFYLISEAISRLWQPAAPRSEELGIMTMLIALAVSVVVVRRLRHVAQATDSPALHSDAVHYASDIYTNLGALLALIITAFSGWIIADPLISIVISLYIIWSAVRVGREAIDVLMDRRLPIDIDEQIAVVVGGYRNQGVRGFHALRTRRSGSLKFIDLHLEIEGHKQLDEAHQLTVKVMRAIEAEIPRARVQIHTDPV